MSKFFLHSLAALLLSTLPGVAEESTLIASPLFATNELEPTEFAKQIPLKFESPKAPVISFKPFTGKIKGKKVRLRVNPDLESHIVKELPKDDLVVIVGEKDDFWAIQPPNETKAYIFRSFVLDNVVEGNRVNVRLFPDLEAPIIGHLNAGTKLDHPEISSVNNKWFEIQPPEDTVFYMAKEFIEYAGGPELKAQVDKRKSTAEQFLDAAYLVSQAELCKSFEEMDIERVSRNFTTIVNEYSEFPEYIHQAKEALTALQEAYLQKKIAYLEARASITTEKEEILKFEIEEPKEVTLAVEANDNPSINDKMKMWEPIEEAIYHCWAQINEQKDQGSFYDEQKLNAMLISGMLEAYTAPTKNKPGDFILKNKDIPVGYLYSTKVNLQQFVGKRISVLATPRPNNNFAFPAYFVLDVE